MTLFDPNTGKLLDPDALQSVQFNGQGIRVPRTKVEDGNKVTEIVNETDGSYGGYRTEHPTGRVDANVHVKAVDITATQGA